MIHVIGERKSKANENKFTLAFNSDDPNQKKAVEILNGMGHTKAKFIADAIVFYTSQGTPSSLLNQDMLYLKVKDMLTALLQEQGLLPSELPSVKHPPHHVLKSSMPSHHADVTPVNQENDDAAGDLGSFLKGLDSFRSST